MTILQSKVKSRKGLRDGNGFSLTELKEAGLTVAQVRKLGIRVDERRRSLHAFNVQALRELQKAQPEAKPKPVRAKAAAPQKKAAAAPKEKVAAVAAASIPLTEVKGIGAKRAESLAAAGIKDARDLADADLAALAEKAKIPPKTLQKYQEEAKRLSGG